MNYSLLDNKNAFLEAFVNLNHSKLNASNWTKGVVSSFENHNFDQLPYYQSQLLEPSLMYEVSRFYSLPIDEIDNLNYKSEGNIHKVQWLIKNLKYVTPIQKLNLSYCLASICRYNLSGNVLQAINPNQLLPKERVFYFFQKFILSNRKNPEISCEEEFLNIKEIIKTNNISESVKIFFASQVIVWHLKTKAISETLYKWFVEEGLRSVESLNNSTKFGELNSLSTFYRAYAMIPAQELNELETREIMDKSLRYANRMEAKHDFEKIIKVDTLKTYYESTLKEHVHVSGNLLKAEEAAFNLISLDPNWSISYQELGDLYIEMGYYGKALEQYRQAKSLVLPRYALSLFKEAKCLEKMNLGEEAIEVYKNLLKFDDLNITAGFNGLKLAKSINSHSVNYFQDKIRDWDSKNIIPDNFKEVLV